MIAGGERTGGRRKGPSRGLPAFPVLAFLLLTSAAPCHAAHWQYYAPFETGKVGKDGKPETGKVLLWLAHPCPSSAR
jgi:hypothetical protein